MLPSRSLNEEVGECKLAIFLTSATIGRSQKAVSFILELGAGPKPLPHLESEVVKPPIRIVAQLAPNQHIWRFVT